MSVSIRGLRYKIPVLLTRNEADRASIKKRIKDCVAEFNSQMPYVQKTYRILVRVVGVDSLSGDVEAIIPGWNSHEAVRFPCSIFPKSIQDVLRKGIRLIACVNIGAKKSDELYFEKFELAPEPDDDGLA